MKDQKRKNLNKTDQSNPTAPGDRDNKTSLRLYDNLRIDKFRSEEQTQYFTLLFTFLSYVLFSFTDLKMISKPSMKHSLSCMSFSRDQELLNSQII